MKSLETIQKLAKIAKIFCRIIFVFCIVGASCCAAGIISLAVIPESFKIGGVTVQSMIAEYGKVGIGTCYTTMAVCIVLCAGEAVLCKIAERYFKNELDAGTPFTHEGSKELLRLGIFTIVIPIVTNIIAAILHAVMKLVFENVADMDISGYVSVGIGVMFIITSLLCRYGAELRSAAGQDGPVS